MKIAFLLPFVLCGAPVFAARDVLSPLPPGAVKLTGGLKADVDNSIVHWHKGKVPYHAFAEFFRRGRPQFALGEMWGKFVRSGAMQYRHASDPELAAVLRAAVDDILATQRDNGSFSCVPPKRDIRSLGWSPNHIESSTLLEPMVRLYGLTGDEAYLEFARYVVRSGGAQGYDLVRAACDRVKPWRMAGPYPKAYEMLSFFEGLAEYYRVTDEPRALEACKALFDGVLEHELTIVGNGGGDMPHHPRVAGEAWDNTAREQTNPDIRRMMETCTGVTWLKFASQVLRLTGDPRTAEAIERYVLNGLLGAMKPGGDGFSYVNLLNGSKVIRAPVKADGRIHANLDVCQLGLGGASCGPKPLDKYVVPVRRERWRLLISPVGGYRRPSCFHRVGEMFTQQTCFFMNDFERRI